MEWVKVATDFPWHPKALEAGPVACHLYLLGLMWSGRYGTNGFLPQKAVVALADSIGLALPGDRHEAEERLMGANLWEPLETGFRVHDWDEWQTDDEGAP